MPKVLVADPIAPEGIEILRKVADVDVKIGLAKDDDEFRGFINDVLEESFEDGTWADLFEQTAGAAASTVVQHVTRGGTKINRSQSLKIHSN